MQDEKQSSLASIYLTKDQILTTYNKEVQGFSMTFMNIPADASNSTMHTVASISSIASTNIISRHFKLMRKSNDMELYRDYVVLPLSTHKEHSNCNRCSRPRMFITGRGALKLYARMQMSKSSVTKEDNMVNVLQQLSNDLVYSLNDSPGLSEASITFSSCSSSTSTTTDDTTTSSSVVMVTDEDEGEPTETDEPSSNDDEPESLHSSPAPSREESEGVVIKRIKVNK